MRLFFAQLLLACAWGLAACGGGGSTPPPSPTPPPTPPSPPPITDPNGIPFSHHAAGDLVAGSGTGFGGSTGPPAKHCAIAIHFSATSPTTSREVSATLRPWVTTWQKSSAEPETRLVSEGSPYSQIAPDGAVSRT